MAETTHQDKLAQRLNTCKQALASMREMLIALKETDEPTDEHKAEMKRLRKDIQKMVVRVGYYEKYRTVKLNRYAADPEIKERNKARYRKLRAVYGQVNSFNSRISSIIS